MGPIGYSPLPINLVQAGFEQVGKLAQADSKVDLTQRDVSTCHNPTFVAGQPNRNYLAEVAPKPPACDQAGQGPCSAAATSANGPAQGAVVPGKGTGTGTGGAAAGRPGAGGASG